MYCEVHHQDIAQRAQASEIIELLSIYDNILTTSGVPSRQVFEAFLIERMKPFLMILEPTGIGEYSYTYYGSAISAIAGFDMTGKSTADFNSPIGAFFRDIYAQAAELMKPVYTISRAVKATHVHTWECLILPIIQDDTKVGFLVYNRPREFQNDFMRAVLDLISDGVFALRSIRDEAGAVVDAHIVAANPASCAILKQSHEKLIDGRVISLFPGVISSGVWDRIKQVIENRTSIIYETQYDADGMTGWFRNNVAPLGDGVVIQLTDITELKNATITLERKQMELSVELESRIEGENTLRKLTITDSLTGLNNRRGFYLAAESLADQATKSEVGILGVLVDIDNFKRINDRYGHGAGDLVLTQFGKTLGEWAELNGAVIGRVGGEEFAMLILNANEAHIKSQIETLRLTISIRPIAIETGPICITASFGIAASERVENIDLLLSRADKALYCAKNAGRNRVAYDLTRPQLHSAH